MRISWKPLALCLLLGIAGWAVGPVRTVVARPDSSHTVTSTWNAMTLTLRVSGARLPKDALVSASMTVTNRSRRVRQVFFEPCVTGPEWPDLKVLNEDGTEAPMPEGLEPRVSCGPPVLQFAVAPGHHVSQKTYLVLTGDVVQGSAHIGTGMRAHVLTATVHLHLLDEPAPAVQLHSSLPVYALIQPVAGVHGSLHYKSWTGCYDAQGGIGAGMQFTFWSTTRGQRITPQESVENCASWEWHAVAGWLNHPVAVVDYKVGTSPFTGP